MLYWRRTLTLLLATLAFSPHHSVIAGPSTQPTTARSALVIGNSAYPVGELINPGNDARGIAQRLQQAGFNVNLQLDAKRGELQQAIRDFTKTLKQNKGIGIFYYAGHGLQLNWRNFLVPVDAKIKSRSDVQGQSVDLGLLLDGLGQADNLLNLVILDACRNNPFDADFKVDDKGLSQLDAPPGTLLAYATAPGNTAEDGTNKNGLYTDHLLQEMLSPGASVEDVFKRVRLAVRRQSQGAQIPWESTSLEADFSFSPSQKPRDFEQEFTSDLNRWQTLRSSTATSELEEFIRGRPNGKFAELAQFRLDQLLAAQGEKPVTPRSVAENSCQPAQTQAYTGPAKAFQVGERYRYRRSDLLTLAVKGEHQTSISKIVGDEVHFDDGKTVTDLFGNNVRAPDGRQWTPYQFFINDYQFGKRWSAQFLVTQPDGKQINQSFELRVAARERITLPAGTFDTFRIEARGTNLSTGASLERTAWVAPDKIRGFLAQENLVRLNGKIIDGERVELISHKLIEAHQSSSYSSGY